MKDVSKAAIIIFESGPIGHTFIECPTGFPGGIAVPINVLSFVLAANALYTILENDVELTLETSPCRIQLEGGTDSSVNIQICFPSHSGR
jgi:hypothetical protein